MGSAETWVLVADAAGARVLRADVRARRLEPLLRFDHPEGRARSADLVSDRPGRSFDSRHTGGRHAMEPDTAVKRTELRRFVHDLAGELEAAAAAGRFDELVIVAGPRLLGTLREMLPQPVAARIRQEIGKDLAGLDEAQLSAQLGPLIWHPRSTQCQ